MVNLNDSPVFIAGVGLLLAIIGFFMVGIIKKVEKNNEMLNTFFTRLEVIMEKIKTFQEDSARGYDQLQKTIDRNEKDIELLRRRIHYLMNALTSIKLKLDMSGHKVILPDDWDDSAHEEDRAP